MGKQLRYNVSLAPSEVLARLASATVSHESVADLRSPLSSYWSYLYHACAGPKDFVAKFDGQSFRIMPIAFWLFKWLSRLWARHRTKDAAARSAKVQNKALSEGASTFAELFRASWTAPVGSMVGHVAAKGDGTTITAEFRILPVLIVLAVAMFAMLGVLGVAITAIVMLSENVEPTHRTIALAAVAGMAALGVVMVMLVILAARSQEKAITDFLDRLFGDVRRVSA